MRIVAGIVIALVAGQAEASSILVLGSSEPDATPSIIQPGAIPVRSASTSVIGDAPMQTARAEPLSPSIVAMGQPAPPVSSELVAAIKPENEPKHVSASMPMLIRGGLFGNQAPEHVALTGPDDDKLSRPQQRRLDRDRRKAIREGRAPAEQAEAAPQPVAPVPVAPAEETPAAAPPGEVR